MLTSGQMRFFTGVGTAVFLVILGVLFVTVQDSVAETSSPANDCGTCHAAQMNNHPAAAKE